MAKETIRFAPVKLRGNASIRKKRVRQASGKMISLYSIDAESPTFARDFSAVFTKNVKAARRANSSLPFKLKSPGPFTGKKLDEFLPHAISDLDILPKKKRKRASKTRSFKK
jgi:hypothetical protein